MAELKPCHDCGHMVSRSADTCPSCGLGNPTQGLIGRWLKPLIVLAALGATVYWINSLAMVPEETVGSTEIVVPGELSTQRRAAGPVCVPVVNPILVEELNATQAVRREFDPTSPEALRLPERMRFTEGWVVASPTGGLWLSYMSAVTSSSNGLIMPLNEQARTESTVGTAGGLDAPGYQNVTSTDIEAVMALGCAQGQSL